MLRGRGIVLILMSLAMAGGAALLATRWMNARAASLDAGRAVLDTVVVAAIEIPFGTKVEARHLTTVQMPVGSHSRDVFSSTDAVIGKVAKTGLLQGEILMTPRFIESGAGSTLAAVVSPNMRAVSIRVDDVVGVGGFLLPGNHVDVIASREEKDGKASAETILSDIKVLAVDQSAATEKNEPVVVRAVTLEVSPEGAERIMQAREVGRLQLTLRNPLDDSVHVTQRDAPKPVPVVRAAPRRVTATPLPTIQVIRGTSTGARAGS
ncbi:MAG: Flp pilus assembly protein CpaB [Steroidobacteraceae bacterium]